MHQGTVCVRDNQPCGSVFLITLPLHQNSNETKNGEPVEEPEIKEESHPFTILLVDDNYDFLKFLSESLARQYHVLKATNGKHALNVLEKEDIDLVVSDIMMPEMDGVELCRKVKEDMRTSHIPVILLTAKDSIRDKEEGYESGADSYLTKPFSAKLLYSRVRNLLEMRKRLALQITGKTKELTHEAAQTGIHLNKLDEEFLRRFTEVVTEYINREKLDIPFMAAEMNMSVSTLYRKLKGLTGLSGNEFIRKIKLKHSLRLLTEQGLNVTEAAYASGFNDLGHFRRCFKEEYGVSPSKYAKQ